MQECVVCLEDTFDRVRPCGHTVCKSCMNKWVMRNKSTCPLCRQPMLGDPEVGSDKAIVIHPRTGTFFGVTVRNTASGEGVLVAHTNPRDLAHASGIRAGAVITHINNIPVNEHRTATLILDSATASETRVRIRTRASLSSFARMVRTASLRRFLRNS